MTDPEPTYAEILAEPEEDTHRLAYADMIEEREPERAEFIRVQVEHYNSPPCPEWCSDDPEKCRVAWLRRRERELLRDTRVRPGTTMLESGDLCLDDLPRGGIPCEFRRGFLDSLALSAADWLRVADAVYWHPGQTVACQAISPHHGDACDGGRVQSPNAQFTRECPACDGTGRVPRPVAPAAHPITRVTLTTWPGETVGWTITGWQFTGSRTGTYADFPTIEFTMPGTVDPTFRELDAAYRRSAGNARLLGFNPEQQ